MYVKGFLAATGLALLASPALAYVGPGLGLGAIGAVLGILFAVFLAVFALLFKPIKRLFGSKKKQKAPDARD